MKIGTCITGPAALTDVSSTSQNLNSHMKRAYSCDDRIIESDSYAILGMKFRQSRPSDRYGHVVLSKTA